MPDRIQRFRSLRGPQAALFWALAAFSCGQLALLLVGECRWPDLRDPELGRKLTALRACRAEAPSRPLLLMLGSSRTLQGFRAERLNGLPDKDGRPRQAFNFGLTAAGPLRLLATLNRLLDEDIRPALLLVEVLPPLLNEPGPGRTSEESWLEPLRLSASDLGLLRHYHSRAAWLEKSWARSLLLPCYAQRLAILGRLGSNWLPTGSLSAVLAPMDRFGWQPLADIDLDAEWQSRLSARVMEQYRSVFEDFRLGAGPSRALADLLVWCRAEDIAVALVRMPEATAFRRQCPPGMEAAVQNLLTRLAHQHGARLIDARDWVDDAGFYDTHHLLPAGATLFSDRLAAVLTRAEGGGW
jgi:hypothetical protein